MLAGRWTLGARLRSALRTPSNSTLVTMGSQAPSTRTGFGVLPTRLVLPHTAVPV